MSGRVRNKFLKKKARSAVICSAPPLNDKNSRFVAKKCCAYLSRLLNKARFLDSETISFACWLAGEDLHVLGEFLETRVSLETCGSKVSAIFDPDSAIHARAIVKLLQAPGYEHLTGDFIEFLKNFLQSRETRLSRHQGADLAKSLARFQEAFNLSGLETELCLFLFIADTYDEPDDFFDRHLKALEFQGRNHLAAALGISRHAINSLVGGTLSTGGLLTVARRGRITSAGLELSDEVKTILSDPKSDILAAHNLKNVKQMPALPLEYHFIAPADIRHVAALLARKSETPTHILMYGPPGTGKTSFAHGIARRIDAPVYEVVRRPGENDNDSRHQRLVLTACVKSQNRDRGAVFIVDEADNMLNTERRWMVSGEVQDKGWLNKLMDEPGLRIVWIVNQTTAIEPSVLRRFAYSLHFRSFNRKQRERLWDNIVRQNRCKRFFSDNDLRQLARQYPVNAGVIDLSVKKAREAGINRRADMIAAVKKGISAYQALVKGDASEAEAAGPEDHYSLEGLTMTVRPPVLLDQAERFDRYLRGGDDQHHHSFNLLLYGPPGTGKSEFARYLARHLDRELLVQRMSDLRDPYVGMTERHIRQAFDQAAHAEAVLLLDEADALLFPRAKASRSWEVSHTAELLTAVEGFRGLLICTTNRLDGLDTAAIRRFNHKIGFDYLTPSGNLTFYNRMLAPLAAGALDEETAYAVKRMQRLTPGDFKTVRDRFAFYDKTEVTHTMLKDALKQEARIKAGQNSRNRIGF